MGGSATGVGVAGDAGDALAIDVDFAGVPPPPFGDAAACACGANRSFVACDDSGCGLVSGKADCVGDRTFPGSRLVNAAILSCKRSVNG